MAVKEELLTLLRTHPEEYLSGAVLASSLKVTRAAVWKAVEALRAEGYRIDSTPRLGHCFRAENDVLSEDGIRHHLKSENISLLVLPEVGSTNTLLKELAGKGAPEGTAVIAGRQTAGRGRLGRSFYSPSATGLYMSFLLRPNLPAAEAGLLTACAAASAAEAIDEIAGVTTGIKWVNDLFLNGKKICGILTEGSVDCENGLLNYAVVGIGINITPPEEGYPEELREIVGTIYPDSNAPTCRCRLAAAILDRFMGYYASLREVPFYSVYREKSLALGQEVRLLAPAGEPEKALVLDIGRDFSLQCRMEDGSMRKVSSGEISLRLPGQKG